MKRTGQQSSVLNVDPRAPESAEYIRVSGAPGLLRQLFRHVCDDWSLSVHTNGENPKSWFIALACGLAAQLGPGATLTLHSGGVPEYLRLSPGWRRQVARFASLLYDRLICVSEEVADAVAGLGIGSDRISITPAYVPIQPQDVAVPQEIEHWMDRHWPLITATMFFRPEYGFELLMRSMVKLRQFHPEIGCLVMGAGDNRAEAEGVLAQLGLNRSVYLAGDLHHDLCVALMSRSSAFVRPTFKDGDSISVREALALGLPVVASDVGFRPHGTILFKAGDVNGLVEAAAGVFQRKS